MKHIQICITLVLFLLIVRTAYSQNVPNYVPSDGLVLWMPFDGNADDESGNGNDGDVNGADLTSDKNGNSNSAYDFNDGELDHIRVEASPSLNLEDLSFACWFKANSLNSTISCLLAKNDWDTAQNEAYALGLRTSNRTYLGVKNGLTCTPGQGWLTDLQNTSVNFGDWNHIVYVYKNGNMSIYINGELNSSTNLGGSIDFCDNEEVIIGNEWAGGVGGHFDGIIDEVGIWNRELTQCEITAIYEETSMDNLSNIPDYVTPDGLVLWMPFDGNADDESGNCNNGTVNGASLTIDKGGNANSAYDFNGVDDNIQVSEAESLNFSTVSFSSWVNPRSLNSFFSSLLKKGNYNTATNEAFGFGLRSPNSIYLGVKNGSTCTPGQGWINDLYSSSVLLLNNWTHLVYTYHEGIISVYINGILVREVYLGGDINFCDNEGLSIGQEWKNHYSFDGIIDDIGIWNRELTQCEVMSLYNEGQFTANASTTDVSVHGLADGTASASPINGTPPFSFLWSTGASTQNINNLSAGTYSVVVSDANGCSSEETVIIEEPSCPEIFIELPLCQSVYLGYTSEECIELAPTMSDGTEPYQYLWSTGETTPSIEVCPQTASEYSLTITDLNGCTALALTEVEVIDVRCGNQMNKIEICHDGNTLCISPNSLQAHLAHGDQIGSCDNIDPCIQESQIIIDNYNSNSFSDVTLYPIPAKDYLQLVVPNSNPVIYNNYRVFNALGQLMTTNNIVAVETKIDISVFQSGIYYLLLAGENGNQLVKKFQVQ